MRKCLQSTIEATGIMPSGIAEWEKSEPGSKIKQNKTNRQGQVIQDEDKGEFNIPEGLMGQSWGKL